MNNTITCKVQCENKLKALFRGENTRLPRKQKKCQKIAVSRFLPKEQTNVLHIPKTGSTFMFYWRKGKIKTKTLGRMTLILESPKKEAKNEQV